MSSNNRGLIQPNYDLNISDNESDSHSDSEEDVSSNSLSIRLNPASSVTRTKDAGQSVSVRGPLGSLFFARHSLADSFYDLIRVYTEALPKFKKSKVKDPIGFIIGTNRLDERAHRQRGTLHVYKNGLAIFPNDGRDEVCLLVRQLPSFILKLPSFQRW
jgi:hypothetical protein